MMHRLAVYALLMIAAVAPGLARAVDDFVIDEAVIAAEGKAAFETFRSVFGVDLSDHVRLELCDPPALERILTSELTKQFRARLGNDDAARASAETIARSLSESLLAKYATAERVVMICPDNFARLAELQRVPEVESATALRAVLLHELAHALDERRFGWSEIAATRESASSASAYDAVIEGHAQLVARELSAAADCEDGFAAYTRIVRGGAAAENEKATNLTVRVALATMSSAYVDGERFMGAIRDEGGNAAVERAFRSPPTDPNTIFHPEWFLDPASAPTLTFDLASALDRFAERFDEDEWDVSFVSITDAQLRAALAGLEAADVARVCDGLVANRMAVMRSNVGKPHMIVAALYEHASPEEAAFYRAAYERINRMKDEELHEGPVHIESADYTGFRENGIAGMVVEKRLKVLIRSRPVWSALFVRGSASVELMYDDADVDFAGVVADGVRLLDDVVRVDGGDAPAENDD